MSSDFAVDDLAGELSEKSREAAEKFKLRQPNGGKPFVAPWAHAGVSVTVQMPFATRNVVHVNGQDLRQTGNDTKLSVSVSAAGDTKLPYVMPQSKYMYGCTATAVGMLIGYYDLYGYNGMNFENLIAGTVDVNSRTGDIYDMNAFDTVLGSATASREHVARFYEQSISTEYNNSFDAAGNFDKSKWNCIADYLGTNQYWRTNEDLSSTYYFNCTVQDTLNDPDTQKVSGDGKTKDVALSYIDFLTGLSWYVEDHGYKLDSKKTGTFQVDAFELDGQRGEFTFADYMAEIDAGRAVIVQIEGHSMTGYGYNKDTREIIFDDTYFCDQRMKWDGTYEYAEKNRRLQAISVIDLNGGSAPDPDPDPDPKPAIAPPDPAADITAPTTGNVIVSATFDEKSVLNEYSYDFVNWFKYAGPLTMSENGRIYFRSTNLDGDIGVAHYDVTNIDRAAPDRPMIVSSTYDPTAYAVTVWATFPTDAFLQQYSLDGSNWREYSNGVVMTHNGTLFFRGVDRLGNMGEVSKYTIDNIVLKAPRVAPNDFNGNGISDIVISYSGILTTVWPDGNGLKETIPVKMSGKTVAFAAGDFAFDGKSDMLWHYADGAVEIWQDGSSEARTQVGMADVSFNRVAGTGDVNRNGKADILWQCANGAVGYWVDGKEDWHYIGSASSEWRVYGTGDFDGSGESDILWRNQQTGETGLWLNNSTLWQSLGRGGADWRIAGSGWFGGEDKDAIVWVNDSDNSVGLWTVDGARGATWSFLGTGGADWVMSGVYDFDGDLRGDILFRNSVSGEMGYWQGGDIGKWHLLSEKAVNAVVLA